MLTGAALALVAAALRVIGLTDKSLWFDETVSVLFAQQPVARLLALVGANDPHPPLYYLLLHVWVGWFGAGEAVVRVLSVLLSVPVVLVTWLFGRRVIGPWPATLAALLVALAPIQVAAGQEARMYGLLTLTAVASWWALWAALTAPGGRGGDAAVAGPRLWTAYAVTTALLLYSHYYGFFVVLSQAGYLLWRQMGVAEWRRVVYSWVGVSLLLLPWWPSLVQQLAGGRAWPAHRLPLTAATLPDTLAAMTVGRPLFETWEARLPAMQFVGTPWPAALGMAAAVMLAIVALRGGRFRRDGVALLVAAALGPPVLAFVLSLGLNVYAPRYLLFIAPPLALLVAAGAGVVAADRSVWWRAASLILPVLIIVPNALGTLAFCRQPRLDSFDWRQVSRTIAIDARADDVIVFLPGFSRIPVDYYLRGHQPRLPLTPRGEGAVGPGGVDLAAVVEQLAGHPRVWILTVPPIPPAVGRLLEALDERSYMAHRRQSVNAAVLILLERAQPP
jgi:uncharacterized membrane protein